MNKYKLRKDLNDNTDVTCNNMSMTPPNARLGIDSESDWISISKIKVRAEHGLLAERGTGDDSMHVEEEARVTACEVRQVSFRHGAYVALDVFG